MMQARVNAHAIRYAIRIARRLGATELQVRSMVHAALGALDADPILLRTLGERYDGSGTGQLRGPNIPLGARILAVAAALDALSTWGRDREDILTYIKHRSGTQFDPEVVEALLYIVRDDAVAFMGCDSLARAS